MKTMIQDIDTDIGNQVIHDLKAEGWLITSEYGLSMIDKGVDFDSYSLSKGNKVIEFEWDNWFEWKISSDLETMSMIKNKMNV